MPLLRDRVRETTTTVGTGTITLGGAVTGYQSFNTAFTNGDTTYYVIQGGTEWEIGIGTIGAGTLARTTVLQSSNADALVPFSAGTKDVFCSYVADRAVTTSDAATLTNKTLDDYTNNVGANSTHFRIKATGTISKGQVVKATGFNPGESAIEVAVVTSATDLALGIAEQALTAGQFGLAVVIGELFDVNTNGLSVGAIIYSNGTGGYTTTKPSSGTYQPLGWVVRANLNNGVIAVNIVAPLYVETSTNTANTAVLRDGSGNFAAGTITATLNGAAPAGSLTGTTLASNVVSSSLTSVGTLSSLTVSGNLTVNTNTLFANASTNRVGIGTTNPTEELTVVGTDNTTVSPTTFWTTGFVGAEISNASTTLNTVSGIMLSSGERNAVAGIGGIRISSTAQAIGFFTGGSGSVPERMRITETGNVGIGTASPVSRLTIGALATESGSTNYGVGVVRGPNYTLSNTQRGILDVEMSGDIAAQDRGATLTLSNNVWQFGQSFTYVAAGFKAAKTNATNQDQNAYLAILVNNSGTLTERMRIDGFSGNVGIGTASPAGRLHVTASGVNSIFDSGTAADGRIELRYNGTRQGLIGFDSGIVNIRADLSSVLRLGAGNADRWSISTAGHFLAITDASFDIGASGANRPRDLYLSGTATIGVLASNRFAINSTPQNTTSTSQSFGRFQNTGGDFYVGIEGGTGGGFFPSSTAYAAALYNAASTPMHFYTAGTLRATLDASGNLGIGTTSPGSFAQFAVLSGATANTGFLASTTANAYSASSFFSGWSLALRTAANATGNATAIRFASSANGAYEGLFGFVQNASTYGDFVWQSYNGSYGERMRLDASGNLGLFYTPSAWGSNAKAVQIGGDLTASLCHYAGLEAQSNAYFDGTSWKYVYSGYAAGQYRILPTAGSGNSHVWLNAPSGTAGNAITFTQAMTLTAASQLWIDSGTSGGRITLDPLGANNTIYSTTTGFGSYIPLRYRGSQHQWLDAAGTQAMTLDTSGNLMVGATSSTIRFLAAASNPANGVVARIYNSALSSLTGAQLQFTQESLADWVIGQPAGVNEFAIWTGRNTGNAGTQLWKITSAGHFLAGADASYDIGASGANRPRNLYLSTMTLAQNTPFYTGANIFAGNQMGIGTTSAALLGFWTNNTERMRIESGGNVGIGTTAPARRLHVAESGSITMRLANTGGNAGVEILTASDKHSFLLGAQYNINNGFEITPSTATGGTTFSTPAVAVLSSGNVGINESAPDYRLDVNGSFGFTPGTSVTPVDNGDVVIEATNNTTLTFKLKGSDGTVRTGTITLA